MAIDNVSRVCDVETVVFPFVIVRSVVRASWGIWSEMFCACHFVDGRIEVRYLAQAFPVFNAGYNICVKRQCHACGRTPVNKMGCKAGPMWLYLAVFGF